MPITLPTEKSKGILSPRHLVIYSPPKTGKTSLFAELPDSLLADLEEGSDFVSAMRVKVGSYQELHELCETVKAAGKPYKYGILDTMTALEDMILPLALKLYQQTPMAVKKDGTMYNESVLKLPNGAGYLYLRQAFEMMTDKFKEAFPRTIMSGHIKDKYIEKAGAEVVAKDIDLTGKIKSITCAKADAVGYLKRDGNQCIITFKTSDEINCGVRTDPNVESHLRNATFVLSEIVDGKYKTYWDRIYVD